MEDVRGTQNSTISTMTETMMTMMTKAVYYKRLCRCTQVVRTTILVDLIQCHEFTPLVADAAARR